MTRGATFAGRNEIIEELGKCGMGNARIMDFGIARSLEAKGVTGTSEAGFNK